MKVTGTGGVGQAGGSRAARPSGGSGFQLPSMGGAAGPGQAGGVSAPSAVMGVAALLTLQDVGSPTERKRRAVRRAGGLLDLLDEMKMALLDGQVTGESLTRLQIALREQRASTDDPRLEDLLDEIETRAAVEIAKLEKARAAHAA
jgi:hypothetical protein